MKRVTAVLALSLLCGCGASGPSLKDIRAAVSLSGCAGVKISTDTGVDWNVNTCAKAEVMGWELPDLCLGAEG